MKLLLRISAVLLALLAASCLTITEDYTFAGNGSGTLSYKVDMSQLAQFIQMAQSQEDGGNNLSELSFKKFEQALSSVKGISRVKATDDLDKYIFTLSFAFANLNALNEGLGVIMAPDANGNPQVAFRMEGGQMVCVHGGGDLSQAMLSRLGTEDEGEQAMAMMQSMKYNIVMNFKKPVEAVMSPGDVTYDKGGKVVHLSTDFAQLVSVPNALSSTVFLK